MIHDKNIQWIRKRLYIPATSFCGGALGAGDPAVTELSTIGLAGNLMVDAGDDVRHIWMLPYDLDVTSSIGFRVWWTCAAAAVEDRDIDWKVLYTALTPGATALITPATALDTVIPLAQVPTGTALTIERTTRGQIDADTLASTVTALALLVEMDAFDASLTEAKTFLGLEIDYAIRKTFLSQPWDQSGNLNREAVGIRTDEQQYVADLGATATAI